MKKFFSVLCAIMMVLSMVSVVSAESGTKTPKVTATFNAGNSREQEGLGNLITLNGGVLNLYEDNTYQWVTTSVMWADWGSTIVNAVVAESFGSYEENFEDEYGVGVTLAAPAQVVFSTSNYAGATGVVDTTKLSAEELDPYVQALAFAGISLNDGCEVEIDFETGEYIVGDAVPGVVSQVIEPVAVTVGVSTSGSAREQEGLGNLFTLNGGLVNAYADGTYQWITTSAIWADWGSTIVFTVNAQRIGTYEEIFSDEYGLGLTLSAPKAVLYSNGGGVMNTSIMTEEELAGATQVLDAFGIVRDAETGIEIDFETGLYAVE